MSNLQIIAIVSAVTYGALTAAAAAGQVKNRALALPIGILGIVFGLTTVAGGVVMQSAETVGLYILIIGLLGIMAVALANGFQHEGGPTISHHVVRAIITAAIILLATR